ncbi:MAG: minor head protein [Mu-like cryoconite phage AB09]|nr:MAG: minor head protein [Mu-like cryoconite phage AB09]
MNPAVSLKNLVRRNGGRPARLRRPPRPKSFKGLERQYLRKLLVMLRFLKARVDERLVSKLAHYSTQAPKFFHRAKNDDLMGDLFGDFESIRAFFYKTYTDKELDNIASGIGLEVAGLNKENLTSQIASVLGVDVFIDDSKLEDRIRAFSFDNVRLIKTIPERYLNDVQSKVFDGFTDGLRWEEIAADLEDTYGTSEYNAERIARDQVNKLNGQLTEERQTNLGVTEYVWRTALDDRVRDSHADKEGKKFEWEDPPMDTGSPGEDIMCFLPETEIELLSSGISAFRRKYAGQVVSIGTESSRVVTGTPNHPVLTLAGWKFLKDLQIGDELFESQSVNVGNALGAKVENLVTTAEKMFDLFSVVGTSQRVAGINEQFHGDGSTQEVNTVRAHYGLGITPDSVSFDKILKLFLELSDVASGALFGPGNFERFAIEALTSGGGSVSGGDLERALPLVHTRPLKLFRFRVTSDFNTRFEQTISNGSAIDSKTFSDGVLALSELVRRGDLFGVELYFIPGNLAFLKSVRVKSHKNDAYEGFVYNFETETGVYLANNQLVSNCRCWAEPVLDDIFDSGG